jgi:succinoglycan biosynthesis transport protein ExoP
METSAAPEFSALSDYVAVLRRWKIFVIVTTLVVPATAVAFSLSQPKVYEASADVLLNRADILSTITGLSDPRAAQDPDRYAQTQATLARVPTVLERAVRRAHVPGVTAGALLNASGVSPVLNADLLRFSIKIGDPGAAVKLVNAYAAAYTAYRATLDTSALARAKTDVSAEVDRLKAAGVDPKSPLYQGLLDKEQQLTIVQALQTTNAAVVQSANNAEQVAPRPKRSGILGALFGLVLGVGLAFLAESLDRRIRSDDEVERALGMPLLGRLPKPRGHTTGRIRPVMLETPYSEEAGAVRRLKATLQLANRDLDARVIMVTSAVAAEGKSTTAADLAVALAESGERVVLVDADLHNPTLTGFFDVGASGRVTDAAGAVGEADLEKAILPVALSKVIATPPAKSARNGHERVSDRLELVRAGAMPGGAGGPLGGPAVDELLSRLRSRADYVVIDAPPLLGGGDAMALSVKVDAMLLVVKLDEMDRTLLHDLRRAVAACPSPKLGFVVTGTRLDRMYGYTGAPRAVEAMKEKQPAGAVAPPAGE